MRNQADTANANLPRKSQGYRMTDTELAVLEAAVWLSHTQIGINCGLPMHVQQHRAYADLMDACADHAAEHDGRPCDCPLCNPRAAFIHTVPSLRNTRRTGGSAS